MKALRKIICLILVLVMIFGSAAAVYAESKSKVYISDIKIGYGDSGKQALINAGYTVNENFNANDSGRGDSVWIGFKETTNALEAITDVAVMNMNGDYTFSGWKEELANLQATIDEFVDDFVISIEEFRTNYEQGSPYAKAAYELMNYFVDTDFTNKRIGDLFKSSTVTREQITNIFMMGNYQFITTIKKCIGMACTDWKDANDTFVTRLNSNGYCTDDPDPSMNHERELINYAINNLRPDIEDAEIKKEEYYKSYLLVKDSYKLSEEEIPENCSETELDTLQFEKYISEQCTEEQQFTYTYYKNIISILKGITIKPEVINKLTGKVTQERESFYDIVVKDEEDLKESDLETIRKSMTQGQIGVVDSIGFPALLSFENGIKNGDVIGEFEELLESFEDEYEMETVSVYYGVDLDVFEDPDNTALTKSASNTMKSSASNTLGTTNEEDDDISTGDIIAVVVIGFSALIGSVTGALFSMYLYGTLTATTEVYLSQAPIEVTLTASAGQLAALGIVTVICIAALVLAIITLVKSNEVKTVEQEDITYTKIPKCLVDAKTVKQAGVAEEKVYYTYTCAKRIDANENSDNTLGIYGDLNGYNKKDQWVAVYYTKNRDCGDPITSDVLLSESSEVPSGYVAIHDFETSAATNLNLQNSGENKKAIYGYIKTTSFGTSESDQTASVFTRGTTMVLALAAFIVGAGASAVITYSGTKKKYKNA